MYSKTSSSGISPSDYLALLLLLLTIDVDLPEIFAGYPSSSEFIL
jgi:hypothetical protein